MYPKDIRYHDEQLLQELEQEFDEEQQELEGLLQELGAEHEDWVLEIISAAITAFRTLSSLEGAT